MLNAFRHQRLLHSNAFRLTVRFGKVLNAFRHQRLLHSRVVGAGRGLLSVLNAFRHQRLLHRPTPLGNPLICSCVLNAFRHQRLLHLEPRLWAAQQEIECSTPFGIKDCCTSQRQPHGIPDHLCSTPFGIKDCCTWLVKCIFAPPSSAQRLSASKIAARGQPGIPGLPRKHVLNAFRHQRLLHWRLRSNARRSVRMCSTPFGIKDCCTAENRLVPSSDGAQRLSASKIAAHSGRSGARSPSRVLNAFRHQRLLHSGSASLSAGSGRKCSTPFGIKDCCT